MMNNSWIFWYGSFWQPVCENMFFWYVKSVSSNFIRFTTFHETTCFVVSKVPRLRNTFSLTPLYVTERTVVSSRVCQWTVLFQGENHIMPSGNSTYLLNINTKKHQWYINVNHRSQWAIFHSNLLVHQTRTIINFQIFPTVLRCLPNKLVWIYHRGHFPFISPCVLLKSH